MARRRTPQPDASKDVIVQLIKDPPAERWGVFIGTVLKSQHETQMEAEMDAEEMAHERGVDAWLMLDWGKYKQLG